ncbi:MAG: hypothetical protein JXQ90_02920 [Cyclobacteriaceae bacterium]
MVKKILLLGPMVLFTILAVGQGCSDAGFCTMGAMRPDQHYNKRVVLKLRSLEYNYYRGQSTLTPIITAHTLEFNASLLEKNTVQLKVPYMFVDGSMGKNNGIGDISISMSRNVGQVGNWNIGATVGAKVPTGKSNAQLSSDHTGGVNVDMPMYYQITLGSYDLVAGASILNNKWLFATGVQLALTANENYFQWSDWPEYPDQAYIRKYDVGRNLRRGTDIMLRAERNFRFLNWNVSLGLLPIYRITMDEVYNPDTDSRIKREGTTGLALSALGSFGYSFDIRNGIKIIYGHKLMDREVNPDGLTRHAVLSASYQYKF